MSAVRILCVCTMNICRSPAAAVLLSRELAPLLPAVSVTSAGVLAEPGHPACDLSAALVGEYVAGQYPGNEPAEVLTGHLSHRVAAEEVRRADLVLALDRSHRAELAQLHPGGRTRTFTLRQAAAAAAMVAEALRTTGPPEGAPPMPQGSAERFAWWVAEMDAARAYVNGTDTLAPGSLLIDALDIPDPHVVGYQYHPITVEFIEAATAELVSGFAEVLRYGSDQMPDPQA